MLDALRSCDKSSVDCQLAVVRSLGNARLPGCVDALVELAISSQHSPVSEAALQALARFDAQHVLHSSKVSKVFLCKSFLRFLLQDRLHGFPRLFTDTSEHIRYLLFSFSAFHFLVVGSVW